MSQTFKLFGIAHVAVLMSVGLSACSNNDDGDNGGTPIDNTPQKHIVKITRGNGSSIKETIYNYDSEWNVIKKLETNTNINNTSSATTTYTYSGNTIICKTQGNWNDNDVQTYTLSNGIIVKKQLRQYGSNPYTYTYIYAYNENGNLTSESETNNYTSYSRKVQFSWENGNLTKIEVSNSDSSSSSSITIEYSNIPWPNNWLYDWPRTDMEEVFGHLGEWGNMPKYLPAKYIYSDGKVLTYDYTVEKGYVTKYEIQNSQKSETEVYTITWE